MRGGAAIGSGGKGLEEEQRGRSMDGGEGGGASWTQTTPGGNRREERRKIESDSAAVQRLERSQSFQLFPWWLDRFRFGTEPRSECT